MSQSSLRKLQALRTLTLLKKDSNIGFFLRNVSIFFKNILFYRPSPAAVSASLRFPALDFNKKRLRQRCFSMNFIKFLKTFFGRTPPDECFLCLSENFAKFTSFMSIEDIKILKDA